MRYQSLVASGSMALALGCGSPASPDAAGGQVGLRPELAADGVVESVTGGGQFVHPVFGTVTLSFQAIRHADGRVTGRLQQHQPAFGFTYKGDVTCFAVDPVNHRAWIGGVLTESNDPDPVTEVGDDVWFRVLDTGDNAAEPDRSTFLGFEGAIVTSEEYCQLKIWPEGNARTWPVEQGDIVIH